MRSLLKEIRNLAKSYNVKVVFKPLKGGIIAESFYSENLIIIDPKNYERPLLLSAFHHELAHIYCFKKGLWSHYHSLEPNMDIIKKIALKVERFVDRIAAMELYKYDKRIKYQPFYNTEDKECSKFLNDYYDSCNE